MFPQRRFSLHSPWSPTGSSNSPPPSPRQPSRSRRLSQWATSGPASGAATTPRAGPTAALPAANPPSTTGVIRAQAARGQSALPSELYPLSAPRPALHAAALRPTLPQSTCRSAPYSASPISSACTPGGIRLSAHEPWPSAAPWPSMGYLWTAQCLYTSSPGPPSALRSCPKSCCPPLHTSALSPPPPRPRQTSSSPQR